MKPWWHSILSVGLVLMLLPLGVLADGVSGEKAGGAALIQGVAIERLATRGGPATEYRETGTYRVEGEPVGIVSRAYDANGLCWVQCEVRQGNKLRRVYTGLKRFDAATFSLDSVPEEVPLDRKAEVTATSNALYGPGDAYDAYAELTVDEGQWVAIIALENDYAQVEWTTDDQSYRVWILGNTLKY